MAETLLTRTAQLEISGRREASDGLTRFPCTISSEAPVRRRSMSGEYDEVLSHDPSAVDLSRAPLPLLEGHDVSRVNVGKIEGLRFDGKRLRGTLVLGKSARAQELAADIEAGVVSGLSVGYRITEVDRDTDTQPERLIATRWTPHEVSIVSVPADINAGIGRSANMKTDEVQTNTLETQEERTRCQGIMAATRKAGMDSAVAERMISDGISLEAARSKILEHMAAETERYETVQHVRITDDEKDKFARGLQAAVFSRGHADLIQRAKDHKLPGFDKVELDPGEFRGMSMLDMARESLRRNGVRTYGMTRHQIAHLALQQRSGGYATTSDLPVLLENALGKVLRAAYATTPDTWSRFCKRETVPDLRTAARYRTGSFGTLDAVAEGGEYHNKPIPDGEKLTISTAKRGNVISLSEELIINDDMGALTSIAEQFGRAARLSIESDVYALLAQNSGLGPTMTDGQPFFHSANRRNVNSTGSALSVAGLDADRIVMAAQVDPSGNEILDLKPSILLVPASLGGEARVLNEAQYDTDGSKFQKPNKVRGLFRDVVDTGRLTGTRRYLFADPALAPAIVVTFLEGMGEGPILEQQQGWRVDGIEWKCKIWFKAQVHDSRGAVTNAGA